MVEIQAKTFKQRLGNLFSLFYATVKASFLLMFIMALVVLAVEFGAVFLMGIDARVAAVWSTASHVLLYLPFFPAVLYIANTLADGATCDSKEAFSFGVSKIVICFIMTVLSLIAVSIGLALLIIPGAFVMIAVYSYYPAVFLDGMPVIEGAKKVAKLTWGNAWRHFALILTFSIPVIVLFALVQVVLGFLYGLISVLVFNAAPDNGIAFYVVVTAMSWLMASILIFPAMPVISIVLYRDNQARNQYVAPVAIDEA